MRKPSIVAITLLTTAVAAGAHEVQLSITRALPVACDKTVEFKKRVGDTWEPYQLLSADPGYEWVIKFAESSVVVFNPDGVIELPNDLFHFTSQILPDGAKKAIAISAIRPIQILKPGKESPRPAVRLVFILSRQPTNKYLNGTPYKYIWTDSNFRQIEIQYNDKPDWSNSVSQKSSECFDLFVVQ